MRIVEFDAVYGDEIKRVCISKPFGNHDGGYGINIDGYHYGVVLCQQQTWRIYGTRAEKEFTTADRDAIIERILINKVTPLG